MKIKQILQFLLWKKYLSKWMFYLQKRLATSGGLHLDSCKSLSRQTILQD